MCQILCTSNNYTKDMRDSVSKILLILIKNKLIFTYMITEVKNRVYFVYFTNPRPYALDDYCSLYCLASLHDTCRL